MTMDWSSIAVFLAENSQRPVALLDGDGRIRIFSSAMEQLLGWRREEMEGRPWEALVVPSGATTQPPPWLERALRGESRNHQANVVTRDGRQMMLTLDVSLVGRNGEHGLLLTVQTATPLPRQTGESLGEDLDYRVQVTVAEFGKLKEMAWIGGTVDGSDRSCFRLLHNRDQPCGDCPALRPVTAPWPRTTVRRDSAEQDRVQVVTAEPADSATIRVRVRVLSAQELTAIQDAKVATMASRANLTERERTVLKHLLAGRSLEEVSDLLHLSRRTVKFHQGNILQKLGADSRVDLIRLAGF